MSSSSRPRTLRGAGRDSSASRPLSSTCSSTCSAIRGRCFRASSCSRRCGATSLTTTTWSRSTSATCVRSSSRKASRAWCTPCAGQATRYATAVLDGAPPPITKDLLGQADRNSGAYATEGDAGKGTQLRVYALPAHGGYVVAGQSTRVPASNLSGVVVFLIISAVPALLAALIASWLVAGRALLPLRLVSSTGDEIGSSKDLSRELAVGRRGDEVALLSAGFNRMLAALEGALDAQRRFVADASHELRTPLATIQGNAGLLAVGPNVDENVRRAAAADIVGESERMARLTDRLLTLARADSGLDLQLAPVHLAPLAEEVVRQAATVHADLNLTTELSDTAVYGDEDALRQLLWILLDTAGRHARSTISVGVT